MTRLPSCLSFGKLCEEHGETYEWTSGQKPYLTKNGNLRKTEISSPFLSQAVFMGLLQALSERGSTVGVANAAGVANFKQIWDDLEPERAIDLVPHCKLAKVYDPALSRLELVINVVQHREHTRGALGQTGANRLPGQAPSGALERALSAAIEQN